MDCAEVSEHTRVERSQSTKTPNSKPIPGYRLIELLGTGGFGEVWKCEAPGGWHKAIKFVYGNLQSLDGATAEEELRAIQHIKAIRHPFVLSIERVEVLDGELVIVMELADKNLGDVLADYRRSGAEGIPRRELIGYLREAAEALDLMNIQHGLQHLDIKPHNLFLVSSHVKVGDFGLVSRQTGCTSTRPLSLGAITPLYASPELFQGSLSPHSDQYSLALVYQELLTGRLPFSGKNSRQLLLQRTTAEPDLSALPEGDRALVAKALSKDPKARFATCTDFALALATSHLTGRARSASSTTGSAAPQADSAGTGSAEKNPVPSADAAGSAQSGSRQDESLMGYRFLECIGCSPQAEVWTAAAPGDKKRLVKYLFGLAGSDDDQRAAAITRLNSIRYPTLVYLEVLEKGPGRLVVVTDCVEKSLWKRFRECQNQGLPGIPRDELLGYLRIAAETLDHLYDQHAIQHLALNPRNLLLEGNDLVIEGFGLMQLLYMPSGQQVPQSQKTYSAPELLGNRVSRACDQYSLALIYYDLLGGTNAPAGEGRSRSAARRVLARRDLNRLPESDRPILARAFSDDPQKRWTNCTEFVKSLQEVTPSQEQHDQQEPATDASDTNAGADAASKQSRAGKSLSTDKILRALVSSAGKPETTTKMSKSDEIAIQGQFLLRNFTAPLPLGLVRGKLDEFAQQCGAQMIRHDEHSVAYQIIRPRSFWQQCLGRQPGLEVRVFLAPPRSGAATPIGVTLQVLAFGCRRKQGAQLLAEMGPLLLEGIRTSLQVNSEKRLQERLVWHQKLPVRAVLADGTLGDMVECQGKDISENGIGFYLPHPLPTTLISIDVPTGSEPTTVTVQANIVRVQLCGNGWYEVGALFVRNTEEHAVPA